MSLEPTIRPFVVPQYLRNHDEENAGPSSRGINEILPVVVVSVSPLSREPDGYHRGIHRRTSNTSLQTRDSSEGPPDPDTHDLFGAFIPLSPGHVFGSREYGRHGQLRLNATHTPDAPHGTNTTGWWVQRTSDGWKVYIPGFKPRLVISLILACMLFSFAISSISINSDEPHTNVYRSSSFLVALMIGLQGIYTIGAVATIQNSTFMRRRQVYWYFSWMGIIGATCLLCSVYTFQRVAWCREGNKCALTGNDRPHECLSGLHTMTAMAGLLMTIPAVAVLAWIWHRLWLMAWRQEQRILRRRMLDRRTGEMREPPHVSPAGEANGQPEGSASEPTRVSIAVADAGSRVTEDLSLGPSSTSIPAN